MRFILQITLMVTCISTLLFVRGLDSPFVFDDIRKIVKNPDIQIASLSLSQVFPSYDQYRLNNKNDPSRPLTTLAFWTAWQLGDGSSWPFHVANLILHIGCAVLVGWLASQLVIGIAGYWAAILFATLPLASGTVIYAYGLSDLLATFLILLLLYLHNQKHRVVWMASVFALALASKQSAVVAPALLLAWDYFTRRKVNFKPYFILGGIAAGYVLLRVAVFGHLGDLEAQTQFPVDVYAPLQGIMILKYLHKLFVPTRLSIEHAFNPQDFSWVECGISWCVVLWTSFSLYYSSRKMKAARFLALGWFLFLLFLLPTSSVFPTTDLFVERRAYGASAGLLIGWVAAVGFSINQFAPLTQRLVAAAGSIVVVIFSIMTWTRVELFRTPDLMWKQVIANYPRDERAHLNLTTHYLSNEQFPQAKAALDQLLEIYPDYFIGLTNLGVYYQHQKNPERNLEKAIEAYNKSLQVAPNNLDALINLGFAFLESKRLPESKSMFENVIKLHPNMPQGHGGLAIVAMQLGDKALALREAKETLRIAPNHIAAGVILKALE